MAVAVVCFIAHQLLFTVCLRIHLSVIINLEAVMMQRNMVAGNKDSGREIKGREMRGGKCGAGNEEREMGRRWMW